MLWFGRVSDKKKIKRDVRRGSDLEHIRLEGALLTAVPRSTTTCGHVFKDLGVQEIAMSKKFTPGTIAPRSGQYRQEGPRGGAGREVTVVRGEPLPPTTKPGSSYTLVDPTKNKSGKG